MDVELYNWVWWGFFYSIFLVRHVFLAKLYMCEAFPGKQLLSIKRRMAALVHRDANPSADPLPSYQKLAM